MLLNDVWSKLRRWRESWLSTERIVSEKNGLIEVGRLFGLRTVRVDGYNQSGDYMMELFRTMLKKVPSETSIKSVLMIGLGGGGGIRVIKKFFPKARITTIEHDKVMLDIAKRITFEPMGYTPEVLLNDAEKALEQLTNSKRTFDLVIVDLFRGQNPPELVGSNNFVSLLASVLSREGYLAINFFRTEKRFADVYDTKFSLWNRVGYRFNRMRVYRQFGMGTIGDPIPEGLIAKQQSQIYLEAMAQPFSGKVVGKDNAKGIRYRLGPIVVEIYKSAAKPTLEPCRGLRLAVWSTVVPPGNVFGWIKSWLFKSENQIGATEVSKNYWTNWSKHAQRHRDKWLDVNNYALHSATIEEFEKAYHASDKLDGFMRRAFMREIRFYSRTNPQYLSINLVKDKSTGEEVAGLVTVDYADINQSCHLVSFICDSAKSTSVGYGLIDNWYLHALAQNIKWLNFGLVWTKGDPRSWRGYSRFKRQFGVYLIRFGKDYLKITFSIF